MGPGYNMSMIDGVCTSLANYGTSYAVMFTTKQPTSIGKQFVDCTADNVCHPHGQAVSKGHDASEVMWSLTFTGSSTCSGEPDYVYKVNLDACTSIEALELNLTTPGCEGLSCMWFSQGCGTGCPTCTEDNTNFFTSPCNSSKQPTVNDPKLRTFNRNGMDPMGDWTASHPWRAPGSAPVLDPCGMAGGSTKNNDAAGGIAPPPGHKMGDKGSQLAPSVGAIWMVGSTVEVAWDLWANHGGGYQYRLCPKSELLTEECFQQMPLPFANTTQRLRLGSGKEFEIPATFVSAGTLPQESTWAMNPVPACSEWTGSNCAEPQFPPPLGCDKDCWGYIGPGSASPSAHALPTIIDHLVVPEGLTPGDYILGWRWDCEQTPQVWASCADVVVVKGVATFI